MSDDLPQVHPNDAREDPLVAESEEEAVAMVQENGTTVVVGNEKREEWIATGDMGPLELEDLR